MKTTIDLISAYLVNYLEYDRDELSVYDWTLNGSIIKIKYRYMNSYSTTTGIEKYVKQDEIEADLIDYITFVFNNK
jgi:hypothetical protein